MITPARRSVPDGTVDVIVIGAGHSGLAMSYELSRRSIDHLVLERGEVGNAWRTERWDSLTLLTPNWMSRLPGMAYSGDDPDGFMGAKDVVDFISAYAVRNNAPVRSNTTVKSVAASGSGYRVSTDTGEWQCRTVVLASGACNRASVPKASQSIPNDVQQLTSMDYRHPDQLPDGEVLVVGASSTGLQLAQEIHLSGRPVMLAVGEHVRMPRRYRGRDVQWWLHASGILDECIDDVDDAERVRRLPSPQLVGSRDHSTLDLNTLSAAGVRLVGRLAGIRDRNALFSGSLRNVCALADLKMRRMLRAFDEWAMASGTAGFAGPVEDFASTNIDPSVPLTLKLGNGGIRSVVWATGYLPDYSWLDVPVLDRKGRLVHDGGVVSAPGLYVLGLPFLRRRKSSFIHGAEDDVRDLGKHLKAYLDQCSASPAERLAV